MTTDATIQSTVSKEWNFITHHLISVALVGVLTLGGIYGVESLVARHDEKNRTETNAILAAQTLQTKNLMDQFQVSEARHAQIETQLLAQNAQLAVSISARNQAVAVQVKTDATLSAQDAAARIARQTNAGPGEVTASNDMVSIDIPVTRRITASLDELPVANANLADTQTQLKNETTIAEQAKSDVAGQKTVIASLQTQMTDADKACKADIKTLKAQNRKRNIRYFLFGGAVVEAVKIYFTHKI